MLLLKRVFIALLLLTLLLAVIGWMLPREVQVERSIHVQRPPATAYTVLASMQRFNEWSPWVARDPAASFQFSGPDSGPGSSMSWQGNDNVGSGTMAIADATPFERIDVSLDFGAQGVADAYYLLAPVDGGTRITWGYRADLGLNPVARYFGLLMDGFVGQDYETGLSRLKSLLEALPADDFAALDASAIEVQAQDILYLRQVTAADAAAISAGYAEAYGRIIAFMAERGLRQAAPPMGIESAAQGERHEFDAAIPIEGDPGEVPPPLQLGRTPEGVLARAVHVGDYAALPDSVAGLHAWMAARGRRPQGPVWYIFIDDPTRVPLDEVRTEIRQRME